MAAMKQEIWDWSAPEGITCNICARVIERPVNRNAHGEMHVRKGEAHKERGPLPHHRVRYYVGKGDK